MAFCTACGFGFDATGLIFFRALASSGFCRFDRLCADVREEPAHEADPRQARDQRAKESPILEPPQEHEQAEKDDDDAQDEQGCEEPPHGRRS